MMQKDQTSHVDDLIKKLEPTLPKVPLLFIVLSIC